MKTLGDIEKQTKDYAAAREKLADLIGNAEGEIASVKKRYMPSIRRAVEKTTEEQSKLKALIAESPEHFIKPRTIIMHGVKVGFEKGKGRIEWDDDDTVVRLIEKHFPEQADILIKTKKKPAKKALAQLSVAELKKLGVTVEETGDQVVIKSTDSEIDKLVTALLKGDEIDEEAEEAA